MILQPTTLHVIEEITVISGLLRLLYLLGDLTEAMLKPSKKTLGYLLNYTLIPPQPSRA